MDGQWASPVATINSILFYCIVFFYSTLIHWFSLVLPPVVLNPSDLIKYSTQSLDTSCSLSGKPSCLIPVFHNE